MRSWFKKYWVYIAIAISIGAFWLFKDFLNGNGQALMVLITAIYVIATINISNANIKSAEATKEQITQSKRQFEESKRLQVMPYLQLSFTDSDVSDAVPGAFLEMNNDKDDCITMQANFTLENIGLGIAHHSKITATTRYKKDDGYPTYDVVMPPNCKKSTYVRFNVTKYEGKTGRKEDIVVHLKYDDILGNTYKQEAQLCMVVQPGNARLLPIVNMKSPQLVLRSEEKSNA